jgi:hypothetical protein
MLNRLTPVLAVIALAAQPAHAVLQLSPVVGLNWHSSSSDPANELDPAAKPGIGFGGLLAFDILADQFALEFGLLYKNHRLSQDDDTKIASVGFPVGTSEVKASVNALEIPLVFRWTSLPVFRPGAGVYYSSVIGDGSVTLVDAAGDEDTVALFSDSSPNERGDFGAVLSLQAIFPVVPALGILLDGRYKLGLKDTNKESPVEKTREVEFLAGISLGL